MDNSLYISYNESINQTALDIENYYIQNPSNNLMIRLTEKPVYYEGNKVIRLPLTNVQQNLINSEYDLFVRDVKDVYENGLTGQIIKNVNIKSFDSIDNRPKIVKLEVISKNQLSITFDQSLRAVDPKAFLLNGGLPKAYTLAADSIVTLVTGDDKLFTSGLECIAVTGSYVIIELKPIQSTTITYNKALVTQVLDIYDMQGNKLSPTGIVLETVN